MADDNFGLGSGLEFTHGEPIAARRLGGLTRDHFAHGRLYATLGAHGGLLNVGYWGRQRLGAAQYFRGDPDSAWVKLMRVAVRIDGSRHYLDFNNTRLLPFGVISSCRILGCRIEHQMLLLEDALVQRIKVIENVDGREIGLDLIHQEAICAVEIPNREWNEFQYDSSSNALMAGCRDRDTRKSLEDQPSLAQQGLALDDDCGRDETTWIGIGTDHAAAHRRGYHSRSKHYLATVPFIGRGAYFTAFSSSETKLRDRLNHLARTVHDECDELIDSYHKRLAARPHIDTCNAVINSALNQYPELIEANKAPDTPGAVRATAAGYWVWGWDGMTPIESSLLSNEPEYAAQTLRFFHKTCRPDWGIPHAYNTSFGLALKAPFPAQCQFIASLYNYVSLTGDLNIAREVYPTCLLLLDKCRLNELSNTGLVTGHALWPDFPEAMEENGHDISSLNNSLLYQGLRSMEYIADILGHNSEAVEYGDWARKLRASFIRYLYDDEAGYFISSCSADDFEPRKHYCCQAVYWQTLFAAELVSHAPARIASFMHKHLRSNRCLLSLPQWDTAWMADGNQLGSSYPAADHLYINVHKLAGRDVAVNAWSSDVEWFWRHHTVPEAFTPEADNEADLGPDNPGCKQTQAITCWYSAAFFGLAGLDFDHEGLNITPLGDRPLSIRGLNLRGTNVDIAITGSGSQLASLRLNSEELPVACRKIPWSALRSDRNVLEICRCETAPRHPVIVRAHGLAVSALKWSSESLLVSVCGSISGELAIRSESPMVVECDGKTVESRYDPATNTLTAPIRRGGPVAILAHVR